MTTTQFSFSELPRIAQCPHCGTGRPQIAVAQPAQPRGNRIWAVYIATCCSGLLLAVGKEGVGAPPPQTIETIYPSVPSAAAEIPKPARTYLQQALETLNAPDAAAVMAGSAVDAMLKHFKLTEGNVYSRINEAVEKHILTEAMGEWAHEVRLGSNRPRHADTANPHVTPQEARQSVEFAVALGEFLFVLSSRVTRGIKAAKAAGSAVAEAAAVATGLPTPPR